MSRIEDVLYADALSQNQSAAKSNGRLSIVSSPIAIPQKFLNTEEEMERFSSSETPNSMTLSDFMGWSLSQGEADNAKKSDLRGNKDSQLKQASDHKLMNKPVNINTKRFSYLEKLENFSLRSPTARH